MRLERAGADFDPGNHGVARSPARHLNRLCGQNRDHPIICRAAKAETGILVAI
jgi:hypothetical protein